VLHDLNIDDFKSKPPDCTSASSPFIYNPTGHVITGDLKIINNTSPRDMFAKGPKYGAIRRLGFEIINIEIMQHVFVIKIILMLLVWYKHTES
jgi:hypothetical protein